MSCMSDEYYMKLKDPPLLKMISYMPVHSAIGADLCPIGLMFCEVTIGKLQLKHTLINCKQIQE